MVFFSSNCERYTSDEVRMKLKKEEVDSALSLNFLDEKKTRTTKLVNKINKINRTNKRHSKKIYKKKRNNINNNVKQEN